jgi:hypothetical protein
MAQKWFDNLVVGDWLRAVKGRCPMLATIIKVGATGYRANIDGDNVAIGISKRGKEYHSETRWTPCQDEAEARTWLAEYLEERNEEKARQKAKADADQAAWLEKLAAVKAANPLLKQDNVFKDLWKVEFVNSYGNAGCLFFKATPEPMMNYGYTKVEGESYEDAVKHMYVDGWKLECCVAYAPEWNTTECRTSMPMGSDRALTVEEALYNCIAGHYWR